MSASIPFEGESPDLILAQIRKLTEQDVNWKDGKVWSLVYNAGEEHDQLLKDASAELFSTNYLNPLAFKSLHRMEQDVVQMTAHMLHGDDHTVGVMTSGGTESILLAMLCYRERANKLYPHISRPEVIVPSTIHPAFDKAAMMYGVHLRKSRVDSYMRAIPSDIEKLISKNTILIVASSPSYPHGVMDPIKDIAELAQRHRLPFHVDACIGGFMLPWIEKLGLITVEWDFRVAGVTSISADVHKFGYGAKGASVILYRSMNDMQHQFFICTEYPGGIYISPTLMGTRSGGPIAAAWAGMKHMGENGYLGLAKKMMDGARKLISGFEAMPGIHIVGSPCMNLIAYTTKNNKPDIFLIADLMEEKGWMVERQQHPSSIHLTILPTNVESIEKYLRDLEACLLYANDHPEAMAKGSVAMYGLMARLPFRGMVEKSVQKIMLDLYGRSDYRSNDANDPQGQVMTKTRSWMTKLNKALIGWNRLKSVFRKNKTHFLSVLLTCCTIGIVSAQPYIDPLQVRYMYALGSGDTHATPFTHFWVGSDIPVRLKGDMYLLFSPYYDQWTLSAGYVERVYPSVQSLTIPVGFILPFQESSWSFTLMPIVRWNGAAFFDENSVQYGGVMLATYARRTTQKFRLGVYVNDEFFGLYVVPLLGVDWRLDEKNNLFGVLPGRLTIEHKWNNKFFGGATFRAITNSYRLSDGTFIRLDDNQVSLFLDYYPAKNICITLEPGYGIFRKIRTGINNKDYITNEKWGDGLFFKLSSSYRIRL